MKLLGFEFKKFVRSTKNLVVIGALILAVGGVCFVKSQQLVIEKEKLYLADYFLYEQLIGELDEFDKQTEPLTEEKNHLATAITALEDKVQYSNRHDWRKSLTAENTFIANVKSLQTLAQLEYVPQERLIGERENNFYLTQNIKPDNSLYGVSAMYYVRLVLSFIFSLAGYLFCLVLFYDIFVKEKETGTINWLATLPIPYQKITQRKIHLSLLVVSALSGMAILLSFAIGLILTKEIGKITYPMAFLVSEKELIPLSFSLYFLTATIAFFLVVWLMLRLLSLTLKLNINAEKILLLGIVILVAIVQFTQLLDYYPPYLLAINYIDLHQTTLKLFSEKQFSYHLYTILVFIVCLSFISLINYLKQSKKRR